MTLHALRLKIGDPTFFRLLKRWTAKYAGGNVDRPGSSSTSRKHSRAQDLDAFFRAWLYSSTKPSGLSETASQRLGAQRGRRFSAGQTTPALAPALSSCASRERLVVPRRLGEGGRHCPFERRRVGGSVNSKQLPMPSGLSVTRMLPPWRWMIRSQIARPRPVPR